MIYVIGEHRQGVVKIGRSADPLDRLANLQTSSPTRLVLLACFDGDQLEERALHALFADRRLSGEWFDFSDGDAVVVVAQALAEPLASSADDAPRVARVRARRAAQRGPASDPPRTGAAVRAAFRAAGDPDRLTTAAILKHLAWQVPGWTGVPHLRGSQALARDLYALDEQCRVLQMHFPGVGTRRGYLLDDVAAAVAARDVVAS